MGQSDESGDGRSSPRPSRSLRERLATMTREELLEALRKTAEGDRTHRAERIARINDDAEVWEVMPDLLEAMAREEAERAARAGAPARSTSGGSDDES